MGRKIQFQMRKPILIVLNSRSISDRKTASFLTLMNYFFLVINSIVLIYRSCAHGDYSTAVFIIFTYFAFLLLALCLSAYKRLPSHEKSLRKDFLKFAVWFIFSATALSFAHQFAQYILPLAGLSLYAISALASACLFYLCMDCDETKGSGESYRKEMGKFSQFASHEEKVSENKLHQHRDSVLKMV